MQRFLRRVARMLREDKIDVVLCQEHNLHPSRETEVKRTALSKKLEAHVSFAEEGSEERGALGRNHGAAELRNMCPSVFATWGRGGHGDPNGMVWESHENRECICPSEARSTVGFRVPHAGLGPEWMGTGR